VPTAGYAPAVIEGRHNPMSGLGLNLRSNEYILVGGVYVSEAIGAKDASACFREHDRT
jgi:hypothetical protein